MTASCWTFVPLIRVTTEFWWLHVRCSSKAHRHRAARDTHHPMGYSASFAGAATCRRRIAARFRRTDPFVHRRSRYIHEAHFIEIHRSAGVLQSRLSTDVWVRSGGGGTLVSRGRAARPGLRHLLLG